MVFYELKATKKLMDSFKLLECRLQSNPFTEYQKTLVNIEPFQ